MAEDLARQIVLQSSGFSDPQRNTIERIANQISLLNELSKCRCCVRHQCRRPTDLFQFHYVHIDTPHILDDGTVCDFGQRGGVPACVLHKHYKEVKKGNWELEPKSMKDEMDDKCKCDCRFSMRRISMELSFVDPVDPVCIACD